MTAVEAGAFGEMFAAGAGHFVDAGGRPQRLDVGRWAGAADATDRHLFIDHCHGPTLDIGCGPGRLTEGLNERGVAALGIDISDEAVRQTRVRGASALRLDVFDEVPDVGRWRHALLADGNIGIGGDPVRLLTRVAELVRPGGTVQAEVGARGTGLVRGTRRIAIDGRLSAPFRWAEVGLDAIHEVAAEARLQLGSARFAGGRIAVTLHVS